MKIITLIYIFIFNCVLGFKTGFRTMKYEEKRPDDKKKFIPKGKFEKKEGE